MKSILSRSGRRLLRSFARDRILLGFDFDGVLAPLVGNPRRSAVRPPTRRLLRALVRRYPSVIISGRARDDVLRRLRGIPIKAVGNHGAEPGAPAALRKQVRRWLPALRPLAGIAGVVVEDKGLSLAVHYRHARRPPAARHAILACAAQLERARIVGGKKVVNLIPSMAPSKGDALLREMRRRRCRAAIFVGDDETDEDVFALRPAVPLLAIRVGRKRKSRASHYLRGQRDVDRLLAALLDLVPRKDAKSQRTV